MKTQRSVRTEPTKEQCELAPMIIGLYHNHQSLMEIRILYSILHLTCFLSLSGAQQPNVLFIAIDDLNDWVNCMGGRKGVHTPHLDKLAKRGMLFANAHCAAPACNPSRVAIMTGVAPASSGVYNNGQDWRHSPRLEKAVTLPEHFRAGGYTAYGGGKIFHCLSWITGGYGKQQNESKLWDHYWPSADSPMPDPQWPKAAQAKRGTNGYLYSKPIAIGKSTEGRPPHFFDWAPDSQPESQTADYKVVDWAAGELTRKHSKPFFHAVGIFRPHIPWYAPETYFDLYPKDKVFLPKSRKTIYRTCPDTGIMESANNGINGFWIITSGGVLCAGIWPPSVLPMHRWGDYWMRWMPVPMQKTLSLSCGQITGCTSEKSNSGKSLHCLRKPHVCR